MKKILLSISFLLFYLISLQAETIYISGLVTDVNLGGPVPYHPVDVIGDSNYSLGTLLTDEAGFFADSVELGGLQISFITLATFDCNLSSQFQTFSLPAPAGIYAEFEICVDPPPPGCMAMFEAFPDFTDPYTFEFVNKSTGDYQYWLWEFGDGTSSTETDPVHTYTTPGEYVVCLSISDSTGSCNDIFCMPILVPYEPCIADFSYESNPVNPLELTFTNLSLGPANQWQWDFGDGNFSPEQDPVHTFAEPGTYNVCLAIFSEDSLQPCFDYHCELIMLGDTGTCHASFTFVADSLGNVPNRYFFYDQSMGNIDNWFWDFGDGNISYEQNPEHTYSQEGTYEVCLTVSNLNYPVSCFSDTCRVINTPDYFFFGGQLFAGDYPINNPSSTGDTGVVYLYRIVEGSAIAVDTQYFHNTFGLYAFNNLLSGRYLLKGGLTPGSARYEQFFQAYFPDKVFWQQSTLMDLNDTIYDINIHLKPRPVMAAGPGSISGQVIMIADQSGVLPEDLQNVSVFLLNSQYDPLQMVHPDPDGSFEFTGLPLNNYLVTADLAGWNAQVRESRLDENTVTLDNVYIEISESSTLAIDERDITDNIRLQLFPNPVRDYLRITISSDIRSPVTFSVTDLAGRLLSTEHHMMTGNNERVRIDTRDLPHGVYLLTVSGSKRSAGAVKKFIR